MSTYSFKADKDTINRILSSFPASAVSAGSNYIAQQIRFDQCVITVYTSGSVVFSGLNADKYYQMFFPQKHDLVLPQAGSDEVGTGDFFGPVCVCASYVDQNIYNKISDMNLTDSKKLTDIYIRSIGERLIQEVPHSLLILDNVRYNKVISQNNLNAIKAKMHNKAYLNLQKKGITLPELTVIDDFCGETLYYRYLRDQERVVNGITFHTKAETQFISVAIGSIISRYAFLKYMDEMSEKYQMVFPKGAGKPVDEFLDEFLQSYSKDELIKVAKLNFKNYRNLDNEK